MSYNLSDLLEKKPFAELTTAERNFVLNAISEKDYEQERSVILTLTAALHEEEKTLTPIFPSSALEVLNAQKTAQKKKGAWFIFTHKTPTWAAVAAGIILYFLIRQIPVRTSTNETYEIAQEADTIFIEKFVRSTKPWALPKDTLMAVNNIKPQEIKRKIEPEKPLKEKETNPVLYTDEMLNAGSVNYTSILSNYNTTKGVSLQNDSLSQLVNHTVF